MEEYLQTHYLHKIIDVLNEPDVLMIVSLVARLVHSLLHIFLIIEPDLCVCLFSFSFSLLQFKSFATK